MARLASPSPRAFGSGSGSGSAAKAPQVDNSTSNTPSKLLDNRSVSKVHAHFFFLFYYECGVCLLCLCVDTQRMFVIRSAEWGLCALVNTQRLFCVPAAARQRRPQQPPSLPSVPRRLEAVSGRHGAQSSAQRGWAHGRREARVAWERRRLRQVCKCPCHGLGESVCVFLLLWLELMLVF